MSKKSKKHRELQDVPVAVNYAPVAAGPAPRTFWRKVGIVAAWQVAVPLVWFMFACPLASMVGWFHSNERIQVGMALGASVLGVAALAGWIHRSFAVAGFVCGVGLPVFGCWYWALLAAIGNAK